MKISRFYVVMLLVLLAVLGYLSYRIVSPFLTPIAWAIVLSVVFYPGYAFLARYLRFKAVASVVTIILILTMIVTPIIFLSFMLIDELQGIAEQMNEGGLESIRQLYGKMQDTPAFQRIASFIGEQNIPTQDIMMDNIKKLGKGVIENLSIRITNVIATAINFLFMVFTIFFLFKDGPGFLSKARDYMPFSEEQKKRLETQVKDMIASTVYGGVVVAIVQGVLGGIAFYVVGIHSPVLWGIAMSVMSFVPLLGTFSIWGPNAVYLLAQGHFLQGLGLVLFGTFVISMVDNILKPLIIGSRTKMPTIVIFFSVLGGIKLFGLIGLIMGPLIMAVFLSIFEIFRHLEDEQATRSEEAGSQ